MEFRAAVFFLFLYYIRPQDWITGLAGFNIMRPMILIWAVGLHGSRQRSPYPGVLRTPHDWVMLAYWGWVVWTAPDAQGTLTAFLPLVVFYAFTVQSLTSWDRLLVYLKAWNYAILSVALIAVASLYKIDFTGAIEMTEINEGRLAIGTWMHNNPNALGHSVAVVVPLSFLLHFWRSGLVGKMVIFPLQSALALYCIYETQSKGAFLVSAAMMVMIFVIGRPLPVKIFALALAFSLGVSALSFLPRMSDMNSLSSEQGVQGRLMAWELAKTAMERSPAGWKQFIAYINWFGLTIKKATHSSYVQVGADLGVNGLFIYLLALWASIRTTLQIHRFTVENDDQERCRRAAMLLIIAYAVSSWMINREYHTEYFLLIAVSAAMHRLHLANEANDELKKLDGGHDGQTSDEVSVQMIPQGISLSYGQGMLAPIDMLSDVKDYSTSTTGRRKLLRDHLPPSGGAPRGAESVMPGITVEKPIDVSEPKKTWNRIGFLDLAAAGMLTWVTIYIWEYVLKNL